MLFAVRTDLSIVEVRIHLVEIRGIIEPFGKACLDRRRELREETGAICKKLTYMGKFFSSPAILDECIHMYLAEELEFGETDPDDDEFLEIVKMPLTELVTMIEKGEVIDGKTQAAVMKAIYMLEGRGE